MLEIKIIVEATTLADAIVSLGKTLDSVAVGLVRTAEAFYTPYTDGKNIPVATVENPVPATPDEKLEPVEHVSVPVAAEKTCNLDDLIEAGKALADMGKLNELRALLPSFHVASALDLKPEQFEAFAAELRQLGAQI